MFRLAEAAGKILALCLCGLLVWQIILSMMKLKNERTAESAMKQGGDSIDFWPENWPLFLPEFLIEKENWPHFSPSFDPRILKSIGELPPQYADTRMMPSMSVCFRKKFESDLKLASNKKTAIEQELSYTK